MVVKSSISCDISKVLAVGSGLRGVSSYFVPNPASPVDLSPRKWRGSLRLCNSATVSAIWKCWRSELAIKSETSDSQLLISVSDNGVGLPPEQGEEIFKAFFATKDKGTGMGLPISRSIVESHGGRLWARGAPGSGATFQFTLPATVAAHA
jgi:signal transduction histidine kinase